MYTIIFGICLIISVVVLIYMAQKNYNNIDIYYWSIVVMVPIILMAYWLKTRVTSPEAARVLFCFIYLDSSFITTVFMFSMLRTLRLPIRPWMKIVGYGLASIQLAIVSICVNNKLYYKTLEIIDTGKGYATKMTSGPLKIIHVAYIAMLFIALITIIIFSLVRKGTYSRRTLVIYASIVGAGILTYVIEILIDIDFSLLPYLYVAGDVITAIQYDYAHAHDVSSLISEQQEHHSTKGYLAVDLRGRFLCCNEMAFELLPPLREQIVDAELKTPDENLKIIAGLIEDFKENGTASAKFTVGDMTCAADISYFSVRKDGKVQGYMVDIRDATEEQRNYDIITQYNETLNASVKEKTENIRNIQRKIVIGMANMIENRDNNTGGHVKRTSDIIHIIVDEIKKQGTYSISDEMANDIVRAAPTHDLGKISIDSSILRKPGKLTDEEFAIMKTHAVKSGEMVRILLDGVEEERFVDIAYNVARYHHERWDGRGYPEGLVGTMIPLEARIMAVADVYDALVSKRSYKDAMSTEKVNEIMCSGMGRHFDPNLKEVYLGCKDKLEQYYNDKPYTPDENDLSYVLE